MALFEPNRCRCNHKHSPNPGDDTNNEKWLGVQGMRSERNRHGVNDLRDIPVAVAPRADRSPQKESLENGVELPGFVLTVELFQFIP